MAQGSLAISCLGLSSSFWEYYVKATTGLSSDSASGKYLGHNVVSCDAINASDKLGAILSFQGRSYIFCSEYCQNEIQPLQEKVLIRSVKGQNFNEILSKSKQCALNVIMYTYTQSSLVSAINHFAKSCQ